MISLCFLLSLLCGQLLRNMMAYFVSYNFCPKSHIADPCELAWRDFMRFICSVFLSDPLWTLWHLKVEYCIKCVEIWSKRREQLFLMHSEMVTEK